MVKKFRLTNRELEQLNKTIRELEQENFETLGQIKVAEKFDTKAFLKSDRMAASKLEETRLLKETNSTLGLKLEEIKETVILVNKFVASNCSKLLQVVPYQMELPIEAPSEEFNYKTLHFFARSLNYLFYQTFLVEHGDLVIESKVVDIISEKTKPIVLKRIEKAYQMLDHKAKIKFEMRDRHKLHTKVINDQLKKKVQLKTTEEKKTVANLYDELLESKSLETNIQSIRNLKSKIVREIKKYTNDLVDKNMGSRRAASVQIYNVERTMHDVEEKEEGTESSFSEKENENMRKTTQPYLRARKGNLKDDNFRFFKRVDDIHKLNLNMTKAKKTWKTNRQQFSDIFVNFKRI